MAFIPLTEDQWDFCQNLYKIKESLMQRSCLFVSGSFLSYSIPVFGARYAGFVSSDGTFPFSATVNLALALRPSLNIAVSVCSPADKSFKNAGCSSMTAEPGADSADTRMKRTDLKLPQKAAMIWNRGKVRNPEPSGL